jgi:hypothetical protein
MGSTNFFSKLASVDPLAQALDLPGAHKYAQAQAQDVQTNPGPYAGQTPTLAAANAGYVPGSTAQGAQVGWTPNQMTTPGNALFSALQRGANLSGNLSAQPTNVLPGSGRSGIGLPNQGAGTGNTYVQGSQTINPYVAAAQRSTVQPSTNTWGG